MRAIIVILSLLFALNAEARTFWVNQSASGQHCVDSGSDPGAGSSSQTITQGIACVSAGDTLNIRAGTYAGFSVTASGSAGNYITIKNFQSDIVSVNGTNVDCGGGYKTLICIPTASGYITIQGLKVDGTGCTNQSLCQEGIEIDGPFAKILNNEVLQTTGTGIACYRSQSDGTVTWDCHDGLFQGNIIHDTNQGNIEQSGLHRRNAGGGNWGAGFISSYGTYNSQVLDNISYFNHGEGLTVADGPGHVVRGNLVADNWSSNIYCTVCHDAIFDRNFVYLSSDVRNYPLVAPSNHNNPSGIQVLDCDPRCGTMSVLTITNNIFYNGIFRASVQDGFSDSNSKIYGNTIIADDSIASAGITWSNASTSISNLAIRNNIVYMTQDPFSVGAIHLDPAPTASTISNNIYRRTIGELYQWGNTVYTSYATWAAASGDSNSLISDPALVSPTTIPCRLWVDPRGTLGPPCTSAQALAQATNFQLLAGSPAIGAGVNLGSPYNVDYAGLTRTVPWDIGAYKSSPPAPAGLMVIPGGVSTIGTCGGSPSIAGNDSIGLVSVGSGTVTSCRVNFSKTYGAAPSCVASLSSNIKFGVAVDTAGLTLTSASSIGGGAMFYFCGLH